MKAKFFAILTLTLIATACSRGTDVTVNDLQGTWTTDCIREGTANYITTMVFSGQSFSSTKSFYPQANCTGAASNDDANNGTYEVNGNEIDFILPNARSYGIIEMEGKDIIRFGSFAGLSPESRPTAVAPRPYHRNR